MLKMFSFHTFYYTLILILHIFEYLDVYARENEKNFTFLFWGGCYVSHDVIEINVGQQLKDKYYSYMQEPLLISSSEAENKPKVEKLKYFYKASTFSRMFFSWISVLIDVGFYLCSSATRIN